MVYVCQEPGYPDMEPGSCMSKRSGKETILWSNTPPKTTPPPHSASPPRRLRQLAETGVLTRHRIGKHRTGYDRDQVDAVATARRLLRGT